MINIPKHKESSQKENLEHIRGLRVMIVDDNPLDLRLLVQTFDGTGLNIIPFDNPINACNAALRDKFDLFLLDVIMPEMSGFELARTIKEAEINEEAPIMFISALSDSKHKIEGYNIGSHAYIEKPFDTNVLRSQVINVLKSKQMQNAMFSKKEDFIAMITHDLKSPLSSEIAALEILNQNKKRSMDEFEKELVTDILGSSKYMKTLVDNICSKYSYDKHSISLYKEKISLNSLITESIEEAKYNAKSKGLEIHYTDTTRKDITELDYISIKRVVHNLLINAIEYSPKNTIINIELSENKKYHIVSIKNRSKGIPIENPEEIFNRFVSYANKHRKAGSGLGLHIAKRIIDAHNGKIHIDTKNKDYVRFVFTLPKPAKNS